MHTSLLPQRAVQAGIDYDLDSHNPLLVRAVYGSRPPKMVVVVRDPVARLFSAFHGYPHYHGKYGTAPRGTADRPSFPWCCTFGLRC